MESRCEGVLECQRGEELFALPLGWSGDCAGVASINPSLHHSITPLPRLLGPLPNQLSMMQLKPLRFAKMIRWLSFLIVGGFLGTIGCQRSSEPPARVGDSAASSTIQRV